MASPHFKRSVMNLSLKMECCKLFRFALWILLLLGNNFTFGFVHHVGAFKNGYFTRLQPLSFPSTHNAKRNANTKSRRKASALNMQEKERTVVILYNKPPNVITSHESQDSRMTVYEDVQSMRGFLPTSRPCDVDERSLTRRSLEKDKLTASTGFEKATGIRSKLHAIGRLDADTSGLLLLTNDGRLVHYVTNPDAKIQDHEYHSGSSDGTQSTTKLISKTYQALIMGHHTEESLQPLRNGVDIGKNYLTKPLLGDDDLQVLEYPNHKSTIISITIGEGKNRQVRKMFHAIGSGVMKLKRTRIGEHLTLEGIKEGEWRVLTDEEVQNFLRWNPRDIVASAPRRKDNPHKSKRRRKRRRT